MLNRAWNLRTALAFALVHWGLTVLVQSGAYLTGAIHQGWGPAVRSLASMLAFMQSQNILMAVLVGGLAFLCARAGVARWLYFMAYALLTIYVVLDQLHYRVFFNHFTLSSAEGVRTLDPALMLSSVRQALSAGFVVSAAVGLAGLAWLGRRYLAGPRGSAARAVNFSSPVGLTAAAATLLLFVVGLPGWRSTRYADLQRHALWVLVDDALSRGVEVGIPTDELAKRAAAARVALAKDEPAPAPDVDPRLGEALRAIHRVTPRPNVLLIVLESVGSRQMLTDSRRPAATITPNLRRLSDHALVFDSVYSVFPGTARTHVALNTGGVHLTWGSVYQLFVYDYGGPTLASAFGDQGYRTALISPMRLDGEYMDKFLQRAKYQTLYDFAQDPAAKVKDNLLNSWGAREEFTLPRIERWIDESVAQGKPFFLNYLTLATHHPYSVPEGYAGPNRDNDESARYQNALHYSDSVIGALLEHLRARGLLEKTLVAVTGDHGEAFGDPHPANFVHKHYLYEENIKSFLILAHPAVPGSIVSGRVGSMSDVMPTLLAAAGLESPAVPGRNLLAPSHASQPVHFHKSASPEQWGLRDGRWKFINGIRDGLTLLYDLDADPLELTNLAPQYPKRAQAYTDLCRYWFMAENQRFTEQLVGYRPPSGRVITVADLVAPGPWVLSVGYRLKEEDNRFVEHTAVAPDRRPTACVNWSGNDENQSATYVWLGPSGEQFSATQVIQAGWVTSYRNYPGPMPMQQGAWRLTLVVDQKPALTIGFEVKPEAPGPVAAPSSADHSQN